jgi:hypothetical protein
MLLLDEVRPQILHGLADGLELLKPGLHVGERQDVQEAEVSERGAIVALCRR